MFMAHANDPTCEGHMFVSQRGDAKCYNMEKKVTRRDSTEHLKRCKSRSLNDSPDKIKCSCPQGICPLWS